MRDSQLDALIRGYRHLTPEQRDEVTRQVIAEARRLRAELIRDLFRRLSGWLRRRADVARLQRLDDRMLKDIGIGRSEIEAAVQGRADVAERGRRPSVSSAGHWRAPWAA